MSVYKENLPINLPFVSLIIPFYKNQEEVIRIEKALRDQTYPFDRFENIFIDNGSENDFEFSESLRNRNILIEENEHLGSPYSARNRGIEKAKGDILVFIDANSIPENSWLENGVNFLQNSDFDLAGGRVDFDFQGEVTSGKIVDALTSINMKKAVQTRGVAYTANLFVNREVFDRVGFFEEGLRSGGDTRWTLKAKQQGFIIGYCESAVVKKYSRPAYELYRKKIRTGRGYYYFWENESEEQRTPAFYNLLRSLKPPSFSKIKQLNPDRYSKEFDQKLVGIWFHLYTSSIVGQLAFIREFFRNEFLK